MISRFRLSFEYNVEGFGDLILYYNNDVMGVWLTRTGSRDSRGILQNAIEPAVWYIVSDPENPVPSEYDRMFVSGQQGIGWKWRLWPYPVHRDHDPISHFLIHPDGNLPGTLGCLGIQNSNAMGLYHFAKAIYYQKPNEIIEVNIKGGSHA